MAAENTPAALDADAGLGTEQAAELLGISKSHFYEQVKLGAVGPRPYRLGRAVRWIRSELLAWRAAGCPRREKWDAMRKAGPSR